MMKQLLTCLLLFLTALPFQAQDVIYLIGTDGVMEANHASATLEKNADGNYVGEVAFSKYSDENGHYSYKFTIVTKLADTADDWSSIDKYRWFPMGYGYVNVGAETEIYYRWKDVSYFELQENDYTGEPLWVVVKLADNGKEGTIGIYKSKTDDPDDNTAPADIDLTKGVHLTVTVPQAGALKQRVNSAAISADADLVDFLTIKGKMGGADFAYLQAQEGWVSQLQYLDISEVELVYDDEVYFQNGSSSFYSQHTNLYTLSAENKDEQGPYGGLQGQVSVTSKYCRRNNLAYAFSNMKYLKQIKLPKTLKGLGEGILSATDIEKVTLPTAPEYIGDYAFSRGWDIDPDYAGVLKGVDLPLSVDSLGVSALAGVNFSTIDVSRISRPGIGCLSNTNIQEAQLSKQLKQIPASMFFRCKKLTTVTIPDGITEIGASAFGSCENLTSVTMGNTVKRIGEAVFCGCKNLQSITFSDNLEEIGSGAFAIAGYNGSYYDYIPAVANIPAEGGVKYISNVAYKHISGTELNIKEGTVSLTNNFINKSIGVNSITLPSTLRILGDRCLAGAALSSIELPESLERIGSEVFAFGWDGMGTCKIRRITIPKNVKYIAKGAFDGMPLVRVNYNAVDADVDVWKETYSDRTFPESVIRVIIGEGVKSIPPSMFQGCNNIARVEMSSTVESIGDYAFAGCSSLTHIDLPSALTSLGKYSLNCGLTSVTSYMQTPFALFEPDFSDIGPDASGNGFSSCEGPFGETGYSYEVDAGKISWSAYQYSQIPLLKVPNGTLAAYTGDKTWAAQFEKIEQFDGASSADVIGESTTVNMSETVTEESDLSSLLAGGIFFTLDTEDSGDGYNATEGCIVINSQTTEENVAAATADDADDLTVKNKFNGLIFEVPAGSGSVIVDCQTLGTRALFVKIGNSEPQPVKAEDRRQATVAFEVSAPTRVYVYAASDNSATSPHQANHALQGSHRSAYANDDAVKIYTLTVNVDKNLPGDLNGDSKVNGTDLVTLANIVLGQSEETNAADINGDGEINGTDLVVLSNIVLTSNAARFNRQEGISHK